MLDIIDDIRLILSSLSNPNSLTIKSKKEISAISNELLTLADRFEQGYMSFKVSEEASSQVPWGISEVEIPMLPETKRGMMYDQLSVEIKDLSKRFLKIRHFPQVSVEATKSKLKAVKTEQEKLFIGNNLQLRMMGFIKSADRILKRVDDGNIFPPGTLHDLTFATSHFLTQLSDSRGFGYN